MSCNCRKNKEQGKKAEAQRLRATKDLEAVHSHEANMEKKTRESLERTMYKSSMGIYKQLEGRMEKEKNTRKGVESGERACAEVGA